MIQPQGFLKMMLGTGGHGGRVASPKFQQDMSLRAKSGFGPMNTFFRQRRTSGYIRREKNPGEKLASRNIKVLKCHA